MADLKLLLLDSANLKYDQKDGEQHLSQAAVATWSTLL